MAETIVVDASVVVAAVSPSEVRHAEALELLRIVHDQQAYLEEPAQFLLELYAVLNRRPRELRQLGFMTEDHPVSFRLRAIGESEVERLLAWLSSACPGKSPTRGADLAYVWVALDTKLPLVTLDNGLHAFRAGGLDVCYPGELLARWSAKSEAG